MPISCPAGTSSRCFSFMQIWNTGRYGHRPLHGLDVSVGARFARPRPSLPSELLPRAHSVRPCNGHRTDYKFAMHIVPNLNGQNKLACSRRLYLVFALNYGNCHSQSQAAQGVAKAADKNRRLSLWCARGDLNPHTCWHTPLKRACLPIPALARITRVIIPEFGGLSTENTHV